MAHIVDKTKTPLQMLLSQINADNNFSLTEADVKLRALTVFLCVLGMNEHLVMFCRVSRVADRARPWRAAHAQQVGCWQVSATAGHL